MTGAAQGIGLAIVRRFAEEGARVSLCDTNVELGEAEAAGLRSEGHDVGVLAVRTPATRPTGARC